MNWHQIRSELSPKFNNVCMCVFTVGVFKANGHSCQSNTHKNVDFHCAACVTLRRTSSLSLPIKSSSSCASHRLPLLFWTWSSPISIFSCSPRPCPRLGECGWDEKANASPCSVSRGSRAPHYSPSCCSAAGHWRNLDGSSRGERLRCCGSSSTELSPARAQLYKSTIFKRNNGPKKQE